MNTRLTFRLAMALAVLVAAASLAAAPQVVNDSAGVTVDTGGPLLHRAPVTYPESARTKGVEGTVMVEATLDGTGNVRDARVLSGPQELRRAALESVLQWHFRGAAEGITRTVSISFQLQGKQSQLPARKPITAELQAKLAEARAHPPNVEQYLDQLRNPSSTVPLTVKSIVVLGLSEPMRTELLSRLPVHEGDTVTAESHAKVVAAVHDFDEHLSVSSAWRAGEATLTIMAPGFSPEDAFDGNPTGPKLLHQVNPVYPPDAKAARISGTVKLSAVIAADGTVKKLEVISGHPLLTPAAIDAVKQWVYQPVLLNGNPVEVSTQISVRFTLAE